VVLSEKTGSEGSFARRPVGVWVISGTVQLFTDDVTGISTICESRGGDTEIILKYVVRGADAGGPDSKSI